MILKLILVDLDDTLVDAKDFKRTLLKTLAAETKLDPNKINQAYESLRKRQVLGNGWPTKLATILSKQCNSDREVLTKKIYECAQTIKINEDVLEYVKKLSGKKVIITVGDQKIQQSKIEYLELKKHFDKVVYLSKDKIGFITRRVAKNGLKYEGKIYDSVTLVDDRIDLLTEATKFPWLRIIHPEKL